MYVYSQLVQSRVKVIFVPDYTCFILCLDVCLRPCIRESTTSYLSTYTVLVILVFAVTVRMHIHHDIIMTIEFDNDIKLDL